jgi:2Fe-2S ferredoxin
MPKIIFIKPDGVRRETTAPAGVSLMEVARQNSVRGIASDCGGACACATCHVYILPPWLERLEPPDEMEEGMLEIASEPRPNSRLSCQIQITAELDGLEVGVPEEQG